MNWMKLYVKGGAVFLKNMLRGGGMKEGDLNGILGCSINHDSYAFSSFCCFIIKGVIFLTYPPL